MATWMVESYHINVRVGDCAIHLLIKREYTSKEIHSAVLIDGGFNSIEIPEIDLSAAGDQPIKRMITWINTSGRYTFAGGATTLKFDTIVITHWDNDHWGGIVGILAKDVAALPKDTQLEYLKWSPDTPPKPQTVLYCPNVYKKNGKGNANKRNKPPPVLSRTTVDTVEIIQVSVTVGKGKAQKKIKYPFAQLWYADDPKKKDALWDVLGVNFFNNAKVTTPGVNMTPSDLLKLNPPNSTGTPDKRPGMYCIGVLEETFNLPGVVEIVIDPGVTGTNRVSIAAAIMWEDKTSPDNPPRISHYFAGDLEDVCEQKVVNWLRKNGKSGGVPHITSMKSSHHGSHSSTPMNLVENFSPMNVIVSNPTSGYFHPGKHLELYRKRTGLSFRILLS